MTISQEQLLRRVPPRLLRGGMGVLNALPMRVKRRLAGPRVVIDGQRFDLDIQLLLRAQARLSGGRMAAGKNLQQARALLRSGTQLAAGPRIEPVTTRALTVPGDGGGIGARLYVPEGLPEGSGLLVFYHGGGFVLGDLDTHDNTCRLLAKEAGVRVLAVDYRLAPEHPFPAAVDDALAGFRYAVDEARTLGADPTAIAVGGDSAGGNLAAVVSHQTTRARASRPAFQLLFYPCTDITVRRRSRDLFASGFFLTDEDLDWFADRYVPIVSDRRDPRVSVLLAEDLSGLPPAYVATSGFDPLRDEGEAFCQRLAAAGVPVAHHRQRDLIHGYVNMLAVGTRPRLAVREAAGALRTGLTMRP